MKNLIRKFFLPNYIDGDEQVYHQAYSLVSILIAMSCLMFLLVLVMGNPQDKLYLGIMGIVMLSLAFMIKAGKLRVAGIITVVFLSLACSGLVLSNNVSSYYDIYQLVFLQTLVLFISLLITTRSLEAILVMSISVASIIGNYFFRAMPAQLNGKSPDIDDLFITSLIIIFAGNIVMASNKRGKRLLSSIREESARNEERAQNLNSLVEKLQKDFDKGDELLDSSENMSAAIADMSKMISSINHEVYQLADNSVLLQESSSSIAAISEQVSQSSESQTAVIEETSAAITEMAGSIDSIANIAEDRKRTVSVLSQNAEQAEGVLVESSAAMANLQDLIQSLGDVNKVISSIAAQTGLLAMNAAIEAAHAGSAGKGFAVVADEVRKLSDHSSENVKSIALMLKEISTSIETAVKTNHTVTESFHNIRTEIKNVVAGMDEILSGVSELSTGTKEINNGTAQSVMSTSELRTGINNVNEQIQQISNRIEEQRKSSESVLNSVDLAQQKVKIVENESSRVKAVGEENVKNLKSIGHELQAVN